MMKRATVLVSAVALVLSLLLFACTAPTLPTTQPPEAEPAIRNLHQAAYNYARYCALAPDDLLGLKRLAEVCTALEQAEVMEGQGDKETERQGEEEICLSPGSVLWAEWLEQVAAAEPEHFVGQALDNGWTFLGYDVNEERLIRGEPVDILLYWVGPVSVDAGSKEDGWYQAGERWVQVLEGVQNLVLNGGFELGTENGSPTGFPHDIYHAEPDTRRLVADVRAEQRTTVALLDNTEGSNSTSFVSTYVPIHPDGLYLQAGWIKSEEGSGSLGRRWAGDIAEGVRRYNYVVAGVSPDSWQHYAGVIRPLAGADRCQVWLLNYKAVGQVYFDDVLFVEVRVPGK